MAPFLFIWNVCQKLPQPHYWPVLTNVCWAISLHSRGSVVSSPSKIEKNTDIGDKLLALAQRINASALRRKARQESLPKIVYPEDIARCAAAG